MAMLVCFHGITLSIAPPQLAALFRVFGSVSELLLAGRVRGWRPRRTRQLDTPASFMYWANMKRSLFGLCRCYNLLPQALVELPNVKLLQRNLQIGLRRCAQSDRENWQ